MIRTQDCSCCWLLHSQSSAIREFSHVYRAFSISGMYCIVYFLHMHACVSAESGEKDLLRANEKLRSRRDELKKQLETLEVQHGGTA